jgi:hypothetical protein
MKLYIMCLLVATLLVATTAAAIELNPATGPNVITASQKTTSKHWLSHTATTACAAL